MNLQENSDSRAVHYRHLAEERPGNADYSTLDVTLERSGFHPSDLLLLAGVTFVVGFLVGIVLAVAL